MIWRYVYKGRFGDEADANQWWKLNDSSEMNSSYHFMANEMLKDLQKIYEIVSEESKKGE